MAIQLTDSAHRRVSTFLERDGGAALRLGVRRTGCSGWAYVVDLTDEIDDEDTVFENRIFIINFICQINDISPARTTGAAYTQAQRGTTVPFQECTNSPMSTIC